jgi:hypothetical protein
VPRDSNPRLVLVKKAIISLSLTALYFFQSRSKVCPHCTPPHLIPFLLPLPQLIFNLLVPLLISLALFACRGRGSGKDKVLDAPDEAHHVGRQQTRFVYIHMRLHAAMRLEVSRLDWCTYMLESIRLVYIHVIVSVPCQCLRIR